MLGKLKLLAKVSRPEFLPANMGSLIIGFAWAFSPAHLSWRTLALALLCFGTITFASAVGAQLNSRCDYGLDLTEPNKGYLVDHMDALGMAALNRALAIEFVAGLALLGLFLALRPAPALLALWIFGVSLAWAYSCPPLRLKSRSWLAMISLSLVLSVVPLLFVYNTFASSLSPLFLCFLAGHTCTIYGLIIPTEIRDYRSDKAAGVKTMTVALGMPGATVLAMILLCVGLLVSGAALLSTPAFSGSWFGLALLAMLLANGVVLRQYVKLYRLCQAYWESGDDGTYQKIVQLSSHNPQWITLVSQASLLVNLVLAIAKLVKA
jgi:4-hydroxybenzoate polyprenyltransferase